MIKRAKQANNVVTKKIDFISCVLLHVHINGGIDGISHNIPKNRGSKSGKEGTLRAFKVIVQIIVREKADIAFRNMQQDVVFFLV